MYGVAGNEAKTKIMQFLFSCEKKIIEYSDCYSYLGFWFNEFLEKEKSITVITKSDSRALGAIYMKCQSARCMAYNVYKELIDSVVEPVFFYCPGSWRNRKFSKVENIINIACRYFWESVKKHQICLVKVIWAGCLQE